jgi:dihydrofolate synthase/folylpolyglutamate synthase
LDYQETLQFLFERLPMYQRVGAQAYKADLVNTIALLSALGNPQEAFPTVHVAGTNGKGSVSSMTNSILMEAGFRTGLYTSPHLRSFTERIRVDGLEIPEMAVVHFVAQTKELIESIQPSFFEATVAMAFWWFREAKVDIAVIEVGMGGRLDSTNVILPEAGAVTNISMDHAQHLGNTLSLIAAEKAGIFKPGKSFVIGQRHPETEAIFTEIAAKNHADLIVAEDMYKVVRSNGNLLGQEFKVSFKGKPVWQSLYCDLPGIYQSENVATTLTLIDLLRIQGWKILPEHISEGISNTKKNSGLMGRMTLLGESPTIITDVGHNEAGITMVLRQIAEIPHAALHLVLGFVNDKEIGKILTMLPKTAAYYFVKPNVPRGLDAEILKQQAAGFELLGESYPTVQAGLAAAKSVAKPADLIFVGGSTFVVAEVV